ncbi:MAG: PAS domain S-box protein, partial [Methanomicrobiales archaeon]|nr:PAS domain S-box protein [Methanomicrobiales archaeon]
MNISVKTLLIVVVIVGCLFGALYFSAHSLLFESYQAIEEDQTAAQMNQVLSAYETDLNILGTHTRDYAFWDDTVQFISGRNSAYAGSNLLPVVFENLDIDLALFLDGKGTVVYGRILEPGAAGLMEIPPELTRAIATDPLLASHESTRSYTRGLLCVPGSPPLMVFSRPILNSSAQGPVMGSLIMGKFLTDARIRKISGMTNLPVSGMPWSEAVTVSRTLTEKLAPGGIAVEPLNETTIGGFARIDDIHGNPAILIAVLLPRPVINQASATTTYLGTSLLGIGIVFGLLTVLFLHRFILSPIRELDDVVSSITNSRDFTRRIDLAGNDEISRFAGNVNRMLDEIQESEKELITSEAKYHELADSLPQMIFKTDREGTITFINRAGMSMIGGDGTGRGSLFNPAYYRSEAELERAKRFNERILSGETPDAVEFDLRTGDGTFVPFLFNVTPVTCNGAVCGMLGVGTNISSLKSIQTELELSLREKETLMKELHHRVKNNLQIISALIYLQADYISDATTLDALKDAQKRIMSMALLHEKLYRSNDLLHLNMTEYVSNLAAHLSTIYKTEARNIIITTDVKVGDLDIDTAIPCGLIISEAVSNSL